MAQRSGKAVLALSLGLVGLLTSVLGVGLLFGVAAIVLGYQAAREIDASNGQIAGRDHAAWGVGLGKFSAVVACLAILLAVLYPAYMAAHRPQRGRGWENRTHITAIGKSLVLWSEQFYQETQDFPKTGLPPSPALMGYTIASNAPTDRIAALCNTGSDPLVTQMFINPVGTDTAAKGDPPKIVLHSNNFSYAVLDALNVEWKNRTNASAPILADRQVGKGSFWNNKYWEGSVVWGDTHVSYESGQSSTTWPTTTVNGYTTVNDNLFTGTTGPTATDTVLINP